MSDKPHDPLAGIREEAERTQKLIENAQKAADLYKNSPAGKVAENAQKLFNQQTLHTPAFQALASQNQRIQEIVSQTTLKPIVLEEIQTLTALKNLQVISAPVAEAIKHIAEVSERRITISEQFKNSFESYSEILKKQIEAIEEIANKARADSKGLQNLVQLDTWRIENLGMKSPLTSVLRNVKTLPPAEKPIAGQVGNITRDELEKYNTLLELTLKEAALGSRLASDAVDISLPGRPVETGRLHIITRTTREIVETFSDMGFQVLEGPEVELDFYNFQQLNMPPGHPARSMHDTFYFSESVLLRTHTSPNQIRVMEYMKPPIRVIVPGKVYRSEATDATHEFMFYQCEGLAVDKNITLADLRGTLADFARRLFGQDRKVRFRCDYFPYVEPGVDLSINCIVCNGPGCRSCKYTGWLEILGAGMVHPQVLRNVGIDPEVYSGFAFGMGPERISMLKYAIDDIRQFYRNDLRFLSQFA